MVSRRHVLGLAGACLTAGCSVLSDSTRTPRPRPDDYNTYDESVFNDRGRATISEGEHGSFEFSSDRKMEVSYDLWVHDDAEIDIVVYSRAEYDDYTSGDPASHIPDVTEFQTASEERSRFVDPGEYVLVVDNTDNATNAVEPSVTVEYTISVMTYDDEA